MKRRNHLVRREHRVRLRSHLCLGYLGEEIHMQGSTPQTFSIAEFLKWDDDGELKLNPKFQRGSVWVPAAKTYLIDSILRGYPIPKLLLRTTIDRDSRRTIRDVVDGQQRLRTIIDFASGKLILGPKAQELRGLRYSDLDDEKKDAFLSYKLTCEQLINASDEDVLEVFVRINSYAVPVTEAELRNAKFDNAFTALVKEVVASTKVWDLGVLSSRDRVRMVDQSTIAELFAFLSRGVTDGAEADITRYYTYVRSHEEEDLPSATLLLDLLNTATEMLVPFANEPIVQRPHFIIFMAALMHARQVLPVGKLDFSHLPPSIELAPIDRIQSSLAALNSALSSDEDGSGSLEPFRAARATTQRMKSRQVRFEYFVNALTGAYAR